MQTTTIARIAARRARSLRTKLVDYTGQPVDASKLQEEEAGPSLVGVRTILAGHPSIGLTPGRLAGILREAEFADPMPYLELAEDMEEKDLHYAGVLGTRKRGVAQLELTVTAASDDPEHVRQADFVRGFFMRDELQDELFDILDAIGKGFSVTEIIWDTSGGEWMPSRIKRRDPRWFIPDRIDGDTILLREGAQFLPLSPFKYIVHKPRIKSGLPIRGGLARLAAWAYLFKNYSIKDWVGFLEVFGQPYRIGKYSPSATPTDKAALLRAVSNIGADAAAIIPQNMMLEFLEAQRSTSTDAYERMCRFQDEQVSKGVLGQTTTTEVTQGGGSRALGQVHAETKRDIQQADARQLNGTVNRDLVRPLIDLNFGPQDAYPRAAVGLPNELSTQQRIGLARVLVPMGMKIRTKDVRDLTGFGEPKPDEETLAAPTTQAGDAPVGALLAETAARRSLRAALVTAINANDRAGAADVIEQLAEDALADDGWQRIMQPMVDPIAHALDESSSLEEFRQRLADAGRGMNTDALVELLTNTEFVARLAGLLGVDAPTPAARGDGNG